MPATTIHFVRHGKVENPGHLLYERLPGFHLSDVGVRMAQATAHYIAVSPQLNTVSAVYSSPLERTRETAGEILESLNSVRGLRGEEPLELQTDERLIEARNEFRGKRIGGCTTPRCGWTTKPATAACWMRCSAKIRRLPGP